MTTIGIDSVEIDRFADWHTYPIEKLARIYSAQEITYCLSSIPQSAQRFAARFAVREAFLKALSTLMPDTHFALLTVCKHICLTKAPNGSPVLLCNWQALLPNLNGKIPEIRVSVSWTHTKTVSTALVHLTLT